MDKKLHNAALKYEANEIVNELLKSSRTPRDLLYISKEIKKLALGRQYGAIDNQMGSTSGSGEAAD